MLEWKDTTSYGSQLAKIKRPQVYELLIDDIAATMHKYIGCGDTWFLSCKELDFDLSDLDTSDIELAQKEALKRIYLRLDRLIEKYTYAKEAVYSAVKESEE